MEAAAHIGPYKEDVEAGGHIVATEGRCRDRWSHCSYRGKVWRQSYCITIRDREFSFFSSFYWV